MSSSPEPIMSEENAEEIARVLTESILHKKRVQDFIVQTVNSRSGVPLEFLVNEYGVYSTHVMVHQGQKIDVPPGTWRQLKYDSDSEFEFARYMLRKQLEQWGVEFRREHMTLSEGDAYERTRIKEGGPFWKA